MIADEIIVEYNASRAAVSAINTLIVDEVIVEDNMDAETAATAIT